MRKGSRLALALVAIASLIPVACGSNKPDGGPTSTSFAPLSVPSTSTSQLTEGSQSIPPTTRPGSPSLPILEIAVVSAAQTCVDGEGSIIVSHPTLDPPSDGLLTAILDGRQVSERLSDGGSGFTVQGIRCDGVVHTVLLVATNSSGQTQTRAVAVLMP